MFLMKAANGSIIKNVEIRWCDDYLETLDYAQRIRSRYYTDKVDNNKDRKVG